MDDLHPPLFLLITCPIPKNLGRFNYLLHVVNYDLAEFRAAYLRSVVHQAGKIISNLFTLNGFLHAADNEMNKSALALLAIAPRS